MEPAAFQVSYLHSGLVMYIKRSEKLNKEAKGNNWTLLSKPALQNFLLILLWQTFPCSPSSQPEVSWNSRLLVLFGMFCLQLYPVSRGGARSQVRQGRESIASAVVTSQKQTHSPPLWLLTETKENNMTGTSWQWPHLPAVTNIA